MSVSAPASRRSQEERSSATRERLLDATISCLVDLGYAKTTTGEIVRRAGVSRGAQVHHFPTKAALVQSAIVHLARRRREELRAEFQRRAADADDVSLAIDTLWSAYADPLFSAALELIVAARTEPELRPALEMLQADIREGVEAYCTERFGADALDRRAFRDALELSMNVMHGLALARLLDGDRAKDARLVERWKQLVRPLLTATGNGKGRNGT